MSHKELDQQWTWLNSLNPNDVYSQQTGSSLVQVMACRWIGDKPLPEAMMTFVNQTQWNLAQNTTHFYRRKCTWKCLLYGISHICQISVCLMGVYLGDHGAISQWTMAINTESQSAIRHGMWLLQCQHCHAKLVTDLLCDLWSWH